jgi:hypothetical protein
MKILTLITLFILAFTNISVAQEGQTNTKVVYDRDAGFPGGQAAMDQYISDNLQYPQESIDKEEQFIINVMLTVNADGTITNVFAGQNDFPLLAAEAVRLVKAMPNWEPAVMNGTIIKQQVFASIPFILKR